MAVGGSGDGPKLGLGAVGLGVAFLGTLPSILAHPLVRLVAAADVRPEARERFAGEFEGRAYETMEELCRDPQVDAVYIATPHQYHAEQCITAAGHGKHVIVEKPLSLALEECQAVIRAVEQAGVKLVVGHTHSFDPPVLKIREVVRSGELGRLRMINTFNYTEFIYRPRRPEELDTGLGGGIIFNQVPHAIDVVRLIGGGLVRSVRAQTGVWDPARPTEGAMAAFLDFEDGAAATVVYGGYNHFDSDELHSWVGEGGRPKNPESYGEARRRLQGVGSRDDEAALKASIGYGGARQSPLAPADEGPRYHEHFGTLIVSCDKGDIRPSPDGITIYGDEEKRAIAVPFGRGGGRRATVIDELYDAVVLGKPLVHDGRWGMATLEVCLAILQSARERREVTLSHQVPTRD